MEGCFQLCLQPRGRASRRAYGFAQSLQPSVTADLRQTRKRTLHAVVLCGIREAAHVFSVQRLRAREAMIDMVIRFRRIVFSLWGGEPPSASLDYGKHALRHLSLPRP